VSAYWEILKAVAKAVRGIPAIGPQAVAVRKRPVLLPSDGVPFVVVSPRTERVADENFNGQATLEYPVLVTVIHDNAKFLEQDVQWLLDAREDIRQVLHTPLLAGVAGVWDVEIDLSPAFDPAGLDAAYAYSAVEATFSNQELRQGS
jgi:hypothetical protein